MLSVSFEGRGRIFRELMSCASRFPVSVLSSTLLSRCDGGYIPAVVRRGERRPAGLLNVGFVSLQRIDGSKVKIACVLRESEVTDLISPYALPFCEFNARNKCLKALKAVASLPETTGGFVGIAGSAAMEVVTGLPYTNDESDLDVIIRDRDMKGISETYMNLMQIGQQYGVSIDIEVQLKNGYGIKASELFIGSYTLLGKSLFDVQLLERTTVVNLLQN